MVVDLISLKNTSEELENNRKFLLHKQEQLQRLRNALTDFPDRNEIILRLKVVEEELEEESNQLLMLSVALEKVVVMVQKTEKIILDHYEEITSNNKNIRVCNILKNVKDKNFNNISFQK